MNLIWVLAAMRSNGIKAMWSGIVEDLSRDNLYPLSQSNLDALKMASEFKGKLNIIDHENGSTEHFRDLAKKALDNAKCPSAIQLMYFAFKQLDLSYHLDRCHCCRLLNQATGAGIEDFFEESGDNAG